MGNFQVFVAKNRNLPSEHSGGICKRLREHLAGSTHHQDQHLRAVEAFLTAR
jgi:hypothetical protein